MMMAKVSKCIDNPKHTIHILSNSNVFILNSFNMVAYFIDRFSIFFSNDGVSLIVLIIYL